MKTIQKKLTAMLMMALLVLMGVCPSPASADNEVGRVLLTPICMNDGKTVKSTAFAIYRVADFNAGKLTPVDALKEADIDWSQWQTEKQAEKMATEVKRRHMPVAAQANAQADGTVVFDGVAKGLYLVVQTKTAQGMTSALPFAVSMPMQTQAGGEWRYEVSAQPKVEIEQKPQVPSKPEGPLKPSTPTTPPAKPSLPDLFQTGQLFWPIPLLVVGGCVAIGCGWHLYRHNKRKR